MERQWCWRCQQLVWMFDEDEMRDLIERYSQCMSDAKAHRSGEDRTVAKKSIVEFFQKVVDRHEQLTGERMHHNAILHHRRSLYGPACRQCGKLLRTPLASKCCVCGAQA